MFCPFQPHSVEGIALTGTKASSGRLFKHPDTWKKSALSHAGQGWLFAFRLNVTSFLSKRV